MVIPLFIVYVYICTVYNEYMYIFYIYCIQYIKFSIYLFAVYMPLSCKIYIE